MGTPLIFFLFFTGSAFLLLPVHTGLSQPRAVPAPWGGLAGHGSCPVEAQGVWPGLEIFPFKGAWTHSPHPREGLGSASVLPCGSLLSR